MLNVNKEKERRISGMHGTAFFASGRGGVGQRKKISGWAGAGQGVKSSGRGGVTVKLGAFSGSGGAVLNIFGAGAAIFDRARAWQGVHPWRKSKVFRS